MEIRPFCLDDADSARELFHSRAGTYFDPSEEEDFNETLEFVADPGDSPEHQRFWTGWVDGRMMAFGGVEWIDEAGYLCWGTVHPDYGGRGFGRQLLEFRLAFLRHAGVLSVFSDTSQLTEGFYAKYGFKAFHHEAQHWGPALDLVAMELSFDGVRRGPSRLREDGTLGYRVHQE
jgi:GNAT superfamily N-acetyltransferase